MEQSILSVDKDVEKFGTYTLLIRVQNGAATVENSMKVHPKVKNRWTSLAVQ